MTALAFKMLKLMPCLTRHILRKQEEEKSSHKAVADVAEPTSGHLEPFVTSQHQMQCKSV